MKAGGPGYAMNLDSLLDTVTNVVGFLIIVLIAVQLNLQHAALKKQDPKPPPPPEATPAGVDPNLVEELQARLASLRNQVEEKKKEAAAQPSPDEVNDQKASLQELWLKLDDEKRKIEGEVNKAREELAALQKNVEAAQKREPPKQAEELLTGVTVMTRQGIDNKKRYCFICRRGRIFPFDVDGLLKKYEAAATRCLGRKLANGISSSDVSRLQSYFEQNVIGDDFVRMKVGSNLFSMFSVFEWRSDTQGETLEEIRSGQSLHEKALSRTNANTAWVLYYVCDDSFDCYLAARERAKGGYKLPVGWWPWPSDLNSIGGGGGGKGPGVQ